MNYYFVMDDMANKTFNFSVTDGRLDFEIQEDPFEEEWSKPIDYAYDVNSPDTIYYNFVNKKENLKKIDFGMTSMKQRMDILYPQAYWRC